MSAVDVAGNVTSGVKDHSNGFTGECDSIIVGLMGIHAKVLALVSRYFCGQVHIARKRGAFVAKVRWLAATGFIEYGPTNFHKKRVVIVTDQGTIVFGDNTSGALCMPSEPRSIQPQWLSPVLSQSQSESQSESRENAGPGPTDSFGCILYASDIIGAATCECGTILWSGKRVVPYLDERSCTYARCAFPFPLKATVKSVAMARSHVVLLDDDGKVWVYGEECLQGELGLGWGLTKVEHPTQVRMAAFVVDVAVGDSHTIACTRELQVYTWGRRCQDAISRVCTNHAYSPHLVNLEGAEVEKVAASGNYSVAVGGVVLYTWGVGVPHTPYDDADDVTLRRHVFESVVLQAVAGNRICAILVENLSQPKLYVCGETVYETSRHFSTPWRHLDISEFDESPIESIAVGKWGRMLVHTKQGVHYVSSEAAWRNCPAHILKFSNRQNVTFPS